MSFRNPKVSIGLPVYNGENYVQEAIESILSQTFTEFELIISDNASTDQTEEICRSYAVQDDRIRYFRNKKNLGASKNYTIVFELASGEYFKWAAHDDVCLPNFLSKCIEVLDDDPTVVLCYPRVITIDSEGNLGKKWDTRPELGSEIPHKRFKEILLLIETHSIWGLIRSNILRKTPLLGNFAAHDLPLLSELTLYGRFHEIPDFLFLHREHSQRAIRRFDYRKPHEFIVWFDPNLSGKIIFPAWRLFYEYIAGINRAPLNLRESLLCYKEMARWLKENKKKLFRDLIVAGGRIYFIGPMFSKAYKMQIESRWSKRTIWLVKDFERIIPKKDIFILVDEAKLQPEAFSEWRYIPFLEKGGHYAGVPKDDNTAIKELERLREAGANFIVFGWPAFWWLDHFAEFHRYLQLRFDCLVTNNRIVVFNLRSKVRNSALKR